MSKGLLLRGLDGSNPLAFLAALGTLRTLALVSPNEKVSMSWEQAEGGWRPRVWCSLASNADQMIEKIDASLIHDRSIHPIRFIDYKAANEQAAQFYRAVREQNPVDVAQGGWITSLTSDIHRDATSPLQLTRSDYFVGNLVQIIANTKGEHIRKALLQPWRYDDALSGQSLHLEPNEDRRHAYQWHQPSGDPVRSKSGNMLGANRLAIEAMPLFLGIPSNIPTRLLLTGWTGVRADDATWTWPIWKHPLPLSVVPSVLALLELQQNNLPAESLNARGVCCAYRTRRILVEKTPNLTPSYSLL